MSRFVTKRYEKTESGVTVYEIFPSDLPLVLSPLVSSEYDKIFHCKIKRETIFSIYILAKNFLIFAGHSGSLKKSLRSILSLLLEDLQMQLRGLNFSI